MAVTIINIDDISFSINGIKYIKNFISVVSGDLVRIQNVYDGKLVLQVNANYADYTVGGSSFGSAALLQAALVEVLFNRDLSGFESRIENLEQNQLTGVLYFSTKADMLAADATGQLNVAYKVISDANTSLNGDYTSDGATYTQQTNSVNGIIEEGNVDAISGDTANEEFVSVKTRLQNTEPLITDTERYITKTNSTVFFASAIGISVYHDVSEGDIVYYSGKYGSAAVAAVFLDAGDNVLLFEESLGPQIIVNDLKLQVPPNTVRARFSSLSSTLFELYIDRGLYVLREELEDSAATSNDDYLLSNNFDAGFGSSFISNKVYEQEATVSKVFIKTGTGVSGSVSAWLYVIDKNDLITNALGESIFSAVADTVYEIYSTPFIIPIGHKFALICEDGLRLKYGATTDSGGFGFKFSSDLDKDKAIGEDVFGVDNPQEFTTAAAIGWDATLNGILTVDKSQKLDINGDAITGFEVEQAVSPKQPAQLQQILPNYFEGLKLCGIGDSLMKGHSLLSTDVYAYKVGSRLGMTFVNQGINGNFLSDNGGTGTPLVNRVTDIPVDTDILIVDIGTNDANSSITIGLDSSVDITEFNGALNVFLEAAVNRVPNARILFSSPYLRNASYQNYVDAMIVACGKYGIPVLNNITEGLIKWDNTAQYNLLTLQDGFHLNIAGHLRKSYLVEGILKARIGK